VAVAAFEIENMLYKPGYVLDMPQPPTPK